MRKLQEIRKSKGISARELAAHLKLSPPLLSMIENQVQDPSYYILYKMHEFFSLPTPIIGLPRQVIFPGSTGNNPKNLTRKPITSFLNYTPPALAKHNAYVKNGKLYERTNLVFTDDELDNPAAAEPFINSTEIRGLRQLRKSLHLSREELAKRTGISPHQIALYETGYRDPNYITLFQLNNVLGLPQSPLIGIPAKYTTRDRALTMQAKADEHQTKRAQAEYLQIRNFHTDGRHGYSMQFIISFGQCLPEIIKKLMHLSRNISYDIIEAAGYYNAAKYLKSHTLEELDEAVNY